MRDKGFDKGTIQEFETTDRKSSGHYYGIRKMFWEYLNKLGVPFTDPCCEDASTATPSGGVTIGATSYDNNADALAALGAGVLYKSTTLINGSPIILMTV